MGGRRIKRMLSRSFFRTAMALRPAVAAMRTIRCRPFSSTADLDLSQYDSAQLTMMEEMCIVTDFHDTVVGEDTKKNVHLIDEACMKEGGLPHRAFSVFLFNENWELLLQKRCSDKILFPLHWANTCCSHPLADGATFLGEPINGEANGPAGCIQAGKRKLEQELGIDQSSLPDEEWHFVTKVHYKAALPGADPKWGEHEVDYILLTQRPQALIEESLTVNPGEVEAVQWVSQEACREFIKAAGNPNALDEAGRQGDWISPWFGEIENILLHGWWDQLKAGQKVQPDGIIHRLKGGNEAMAAAGAK